jgi:DNA-binding winged helix-turn-helix (wHTH) protein
MMDLKRNPYNCSLNLDSNGKPLVQDVSARTIQEKDASNRKFERAVVAYHRGDYTLALKKFEQVSHSSWQLKDHFRFVESCAYTLRILAEREEFAKAEPIETKLLSVLNSNVDLHLKLKSRALYTLGICSCYRDGRRAGSRFEPIDNDYDQNHEAMRCFREAIDLAIRSGDREALASPLYGLATVLYAGGHYVEALKELDRVDVLVSCLNLSDLGSAAYLLRSLICRNQNKFEDALAAAWAAFESLKNHPHIILYLHTLVALSSIHLQKNEPASAMLYIDLVNRSLKRDEFPRIARLVDEILMALGATSGPQPDLIFDSKTGVLLSKDKGEIRFEGQFVLRDLLLAFLKKPGHVFNKEELVRLIWREDYVAAIHDNKIYVTIKRLRKLLEAPNNPKTEYVLRAKTGYFFNPKINIRINEPVGENRSDKGKLELPCES